nr:ORF1 [Drosophila melanogaster]
MQCFKLASRRSLYNARVLQADNIGDKQRSPDLERRAKIPR